VQATSFVIKALQKPECLTQGRSR